MELFVNLVNVNHCVGIQATSKAYWENVSELDLAECAFLQAF